MAATDSDNRPATDAELAEMAEHFVAAMSDTVPVIHGHAEGFAILARRARESPAFRAAVRHVRDDLRALREALAHLASEFDAFEVATDE